ncbi:MAG: efflux RND transporter periplasmic adaptor subunit [Thermodesulfobacteriota bacterium]|nr:efflux RND transporter periplasmic adaptor subunit [Thermodesulfobacteriota bacterium]
MNSEISEKSTPKIITRIIICVLVLTVGYGCMKILRSMKKPPAEVEFREHSLKVETICARMEDVPVVIRGFGEITALDSVEISPEVSGKTIAVHSRLEQGGIILKGELLFAVDSSDYAAALEETRAEAERLKISISRLEKQFEIDKKRMEIMERNRELARAEYERARRLFETNRAMASSAVDSKEQAFNVSADLVEKMALTVELYPIKIAEQKYTFKAALARLKLAQTRLERCEIRAPFTGRIKRVSIEQGQYVATGKNVVTLANDEVLEIKVPLDGWEARKWLRFNGESSNSTSGWFSGLVPVRCNIRWTEEPDGPGRQGTLHRVVEFDPQTRTLTVAIRVLAKEMSGGDSGGLPLVDGMFCSVEIPGRIMRNVVRLPRWAVSFQNTAYIVRENRLKTVSVQVASVEGETTFVSSGLNPGDAVIVTRLVDPQENALIEIKNKGTAEK